jgi:hypothetical protein
VLQAGSFIAGKAVEMHMIVMMMAVVARRTDGILRLKLIIRNAVQDTGIKKLFEAAVNGGTVNQPGKLFFKIGMGEGIWMPQKGFQNFYPLTGLPKFEILQKCCRLIFH